MLNMEDIKFGYTRVSQILSMMPTVCTNEQDGKQDWKFPIKEIPPLTLFRKTRIGTNVHAAIHAYYKEDFYPLHPEENGYLASFHQWREFVKLKTVESEIRLYDENLKITGAIDMLGVLNDQTHITLIDFKTTAACDKKKWPLQAAFYHNLLKVNKFEVSPNVIFLQLDKEGAYPKLHTYTIDKKLNSLMVSAYNLYTHLTEK